MEEPKVHTQTAAPKGGSDRERRAQDQRAVGHGVPLGSNPSLAHRYENGFVDMDAKHRGWSSYLGAGVERGKKGAKGRREGRSSEAEQVQPTGAMDKDKSEKERLKQLDTFSKHLQSASNKAKSSSRAMF
jgi:hypothetical protein